ncbi:MAG: HupE/UreJ family protein [Tepidimonas sp.]|uniref:HupE/UreJ family protein n=1 Tax=Tepidimonas sp. TaxID=2002775 RepID=UPI00298F17B8|nr:HupE/UreJ family protein [Tepidimonas sp.]MCS6810836.1 HupE/UreJ family protein [Tepidimonas sp.]MDW8336945.1 HupE/UreJ family protein [Tepidimonas sp.]
MLPLSWFRERLRASLAAAFALAAWHAPGLAHTGADAGAHHGWLAGLLHPLTGLDHLAVMVAVGLWSALSARQRWLAPLAFASVLSLGALAAQAGLAVPLVEPMIAASLLVVGLLIAAHIALPQGVVALLVAGFAWFHGAAHGQELSGLPALAGMVVSTALLHIAGIALGLALQRWHAWAPRAAGAAVATVGVVSAAALW